GPLAGADARHLVQPPALAQPQQALLLTHPDRPIGADVEGGRRPGDGGGAVDAAVTNARQAAHGAGPDGTARAASGRHREHVVVRQAVARGVGALAPAAPAQEAPWRSEPEGAGAILAPALDALPLEQTRRPGPGRHHAIGELGHPAAAGPHPQAPLTVLVERGHVVVGE